MSKKVRVTNIYEIVWPHVCAKCGETLHLKNAASLENKLTTKIAKIDPQLEYYFCEKHAKLLAMANLSVDNCGTMTLVRLVSYFATALFCIFLITLPLQQIPIHKTKFSTKEYVLEFENHDVAEMFVKDNQQHTLVERLN